MECASCEFENPDGMKFCGACGAELKRLCSKCNYPNPPQFKFCGECGQNLVPTSDSPTREMTPEEKIAKIKRYLPEGLTEKVLTQRGRIEGERRHVTIMFCDMKGFTSLTERLGPEETFTLMDRLYEIIINKIHDYGGTINELRGDGVLAIFGAPVALEDAPQRAIRSSLAIHRAMSKFTQEIKTERDIPPILLRIGMNTGPVVVGAVGNDLRVQFTAVGDTINMAARMEGLAEPGTTYVTEDTFKFTEGFFRFEALGEKPVKGKEAPIKVYRVIAPRSLLTRFDVSAEQGLTPLVGRARELNLLVDVFEGTMSGRGQAVSIVAEAGIGKSRLLYEFRKAMANEDVTFMEGRCLSYSRGVVYHPIIDVLKANFDIAEDDDDSRIRDKVGRGLSRLNIGPEETLPYVLELLSARDSGVDRPLQSPEARKERTIEAIKRIVLHGAQVRPLILAIEDLHWIDNSSEDALRVVLEAIGGARILLIFTHRPEFQPSWGMRSYHGRVNLNRLSRRESLAMINHLLNGADLEPVLQELVLDKTEGTPFFIEQFVYSIRDLKFTAKRDNVYGLIDRAERVSIPGTIQDVIMARVDGLDDGAKAVLQAGSGVEREFGFDLIQRVTGLDRATLTGHLESLKDSELIYERSMSPDSAFVFKHALTRDVVYDSILARRKRELHQRIGEAMEQTHRENLREVCECLASHFERSEDFNRAADYFKMAGAKATNSGAMTESVEYARKTVDCLERLPGSEEVLRKIVDIRTILGIRLMDLNYFQQSKKIISPVINTADCLESTRRIAQINTILGSYQFCVKEDFTKAFDHHYRSLGIAKNLDDTNLLAMAHYWLGWPLAFLCDFKNALGHFNQALDIHVREANTIWVPIITALTGYLAYHYWGQQKFADEYSHKAVVLADKSGDVYTLLLTYSCHGVSCLGKGDLEAALEYLSAGLALAEQVDQFYWRPGNHQHLGDTYYELGDYQQSIHHYQEAIKNLERSGNLPSWKKLVELSLIRAQLAVGERPDFDAESLGNYSDANKLRVYDGLFKRRVGEIMLYLGRCDEAEYWLDRAVEAHEQNRMLFHLAGDCAVRADLSKRQGDQGEAQEYLTRATDVFKKCGADGWVERAEKDLAEMA